MKIPLVIFFKLKNKRKRFFDTIVDNATNIRQGIGKEEKNHFNRNRISSKNKIGLVLLCLATWHG